MSHQALADAFAPIEARNREIMRQNTWGHLAPKRHTEYRGYIVFAVGCFGNDPLNPVALACDFGELDSSPWFFDAMSDFIADAKTEEGCVYRFDGTFRNYKFKGKIRKCQIVPEGAR